MNMTEEQLEQLGLVEITFGKSDDFLKIKETLTRIGIPNLEKDSLSQTCHILHKRGKYYIAHFLQLFVLDGKRTSFDVEDRARLNYIVKMLEKWELISVVDKAALESLVYIGKPNIYVVPYRDKHKWKLIQKYTIGQGN